MTRIFIADAGIRAEQVAAIRAALPQGWALAETPAGASAILTENADITPAMLAAAGAALRVLLRLDTGRASVALSAAPLVELPNTALTGVAEHTIALILALRRRLLWVARQTAERHYLPGRDQPIETDQRRYTYNWVGLEEFGTLYRASVGIVGLGIIGRAVAARLRPFGVRLLYTQRTRLAADDEARLGVSFRPLDELLRQSDVVTLHHRFQEGPGGNDRQFGAREFALMRPGAIFINTARGRMVDEQALAEALRSGQIAGAGLDVFRYEPLPDDSPLLPLAGDSLILTAHVAGAPMAEAWRHIAEECIEQISVRLSLDIAS